MILVNQPIHSLFHGVSRQPGPIRLPGQVEDANNVLFSVVSSGFSKRANTRHIATLNSEIGAGAITAHSYQRDANEQYWIVIRDGDLKVYDLSGTERSVTFTHGRGYLQGAADFAFTTILDFTLIANTSTVVAMEAANLASTVTSAGSLPTATAGLLGDIYLVGGTHYECVLDAPAVAARSGWVFNADATSPGVHDVVSELPDANTASGFVALDRTLTTAVTTDGVRASLGSRYAIYQWTELVSASSATYKWAVRSAPSDAAASITGSVETYTDLPASGTNGDIYRVTGGATELDDYYVTWASDTTSWIETADPRIANILDAATMPHALIRESDGTFTFERNEWEPRQVGDALVVPEPDFVGNTVQDLAFFRDRLCMIAGEVIYAGQAGDYFNMWPDEATQVLDSDPFGRTASGSAVNRLRYATAFRRALFATTESGQFELSSGSRNVLTPETAVLDGTTNYQVDTACRPIAIGDTLYFASKNGRKAAVFEYYYEEDSLSDTAADVSLHADGYLPSPLTSVVGDTTTNTIFFQSSDDTNAIYVLRSYWDGDERAQTAWSRYTFAAGTEIVALAYMLGEFYVLMLDGLGQLQLEVMEVDPSDGPLNHPNPVLWDKTVLLTGTYSSQTGMTTWTVPYETLGATRAMLSTDFAVGVAGSLLGVWYTEGNKMVAMGDYSSGRAIIGVPYLSRTRLSRQYVREDGGNGRAITSGRLQLRRMFLDYQSTGYFEVVVSPNQRSNRTYKMTGRYVGQADNVVGGQPIIDGTFVFSVGGKADQLEIDIQSASYLPFTITGAAWIGAYNEITRQENGSL